MLNNAWECACLVRWPKNLLHGEKKIMTLPFPSTLHPASLPQIKYKHQDSNKIHVFFTKSQEGVPEQYYLGTPDFLFPSHHKRLCVGDTYRLRPLGGRGVLMGYPSFLTLFYSLQFVVLQVFLLEPQSGVHTHPSGISIAPCHSFLLCVLPAAINPSIPGFANSKGKGVCSGFMRQRDRKCLDSTSLPARNVVDFLCLKKQAYSSKQVFICTHHIPNPAPKT